MSADSDYGENVSRGNNAPRVEVLEKRSMNRRINPHRRWRTGLYIPDWIMLHPGLPLGAKVLYARIARYAMKHGYAFAKQTTLAKDLGVARSTIQLFIRQLVEQRLVEVVQNGPAKENYYYLLENAWEKESLAVDSTLDQSSVTQIVQIRDANDRVQGSSRPNSGHLSNIEEKNRIKEYHTHHFPTPSFLQVLEEGEISNIAQDVCESFYNDKQSVGWRHNGQPIVDWQSALKAYNGRWIRNENHKPRGRVSGRKGPLQNRSYTNQLVEDRL